MIYTDRSRVLAYQTCPRSRWLRYHAGVQGFSRVHLSLPLACGTYVHIGLQALLENKSVDEAVGLATEGFRAEASRRGFLGDEGEPVANDLAGYVLAEQVALIEALVRVYASYHLPNLLKEYEILESEKEDTFTLTPSIKWMGRADGLLRKRDSGDLYIMSFKTAGKYDERTSLAGRHDVQGLSEALAIENRLGERFFGIKMEYLVKGMRKPDDSGVYRQESHLIRPYRKIDSDGVKWAWSYFWNCTEPHDTTWSNGRKVKCPGGKKHGLGQTYERVNIWEIMPIKEWLEMLPEVQPGAGDPFAGVIVLPMPYFRNDLDAESWRRQTRAQELRIARDVEYVKLVQAGGDKNQIRAALDLTFPQYKRSCDYPSACEFQPICYEVEDAVFDPESLGIYEPRRPHHEPELVQIQGVKE